MRPAGITTDHPMPHVAANETTLCTSLELSHKTWLLTVLSPGSQKMSKFSTQAGNGDALIELLDRLRSKAEAAVGGPIRIAVIQEAGLDGFWVHRLLEAHDIESHVVDPASIAVPRRQRRAKTDVINGETLLRTLLAWRRGEPRVCAMVVPPSPDEEDRRRTCRERAILLRERIRHVNRVKGLLSGQGIVDYEPLERDRRARLEELRTGDGRPLPPRLRAVPESLADPDLKRRLDGMNVEATPGTPAEFAKLIADERRTWADVVQRANIKAE